MFAILLAGISRLNIRARSVGKQELPEGQPARGLRSRFGAENTVDVSRVDTHCPPRQGACRNDGRSSVSFEQRFRVQSTGLCSVSLIGSGPAKDVLKKKRMFEWAAEAAWLVLLGKGRRALGQKSHQLM